MSAEFSRWLSSTPLSALDAERAMGAMMDGDLSAVRTAAVLTALKVRGETVEEILGFARAMRARAVRVPVTPGVIADTCGTGGTGVSTFNISTAAAFVVAAGGVRVAKHGNRTAGRKSGSADVLEALGVNLEISAERAAEAVNTLGIGFLFARSYHPAMRTVAPVRADLNVRTVFNILGPLTNPAGATHQLLGVPDSSLTRTMAEALRGLGSAAALVVAGSAPDGTRYDDISVAGTTWVAELRAGAVREYTLEPEDLCVARHQSVELLGGEPAENAKTVRAVLGGDGTDAQRDAVAVNAGATLYITDAAPSIQAGTARALEVLRSGAALELLDRYAAFTRG
jgi:anthranilate phosphoribosyltransferase